MHIKNVPASKSKKFKKINWWISKKIVQTRKKVLTSGWGNGKLIGRVWEDAEKSIDNDTANIVELKSVAMAEVHLVN